MATDWLSIRNEYVTLGKSVRELAKAHGLTKTAVGSRCTREGWESMRKQYADTLRTECVQLTASAVATTEADRLARMMQRSDRLGELCDMWIERAVDKGAKPQDIKAMAEALMKLSEIGKAVGPKDTEITIKFASPEEAEWAE